MRTLKKSFALLFVLAPLHLSAAEPEVVFPEKHFTFIDTYCLTCHDADTEKGKVNLEDLSFHITTIEQAERWQKVLNSINSKEMPPEDKKQPENAEKADFLDALAQTMVAARKSLSDSGGEITMRRLNRREYRNTIEYLTGVRVDAGTLPSDEGSGTFDTAGASQFISSDQFEQYLKLGRSAIDEVFEREAALARETQVFRVEPEKTVNVKHLKSIKEMEEKLEHLKPWMAAVDQAVKAPENKAVMEQLRKEHPDIDTHSWRIYRMSNRLKGVPELKKFGGDPDSAMNFYQLAYGKSYASLKHYAELPHNDRGTYLRPVSGVVRLDVTPPKKDLPPGSYRLRFRAGIVEGSPPERHFIEVGHPQRINQVAAGFAGHPLSSHQVTGTIENPQVIETTVEIGLDTPKEFGIQERQPKDFGARVKQHYADKRKNGHGTPPALWVDWIELEGPITEAAVTESRIIRVEPEKTINPANEKAVAQIEDGYARFTRWQKAVDKAAATPENQAKIAEIRKTDRLIDHPNRFYTYADRLEGTPHPRDFGIVGDAKKAASWDPEGDRKDLAYHKHYAALPHRDRGTYLKLAHGTGRIIVPPKKKNLPPGSYIMRVRVGAVEGTPASRRFIQVGHPQRQIESRNWGLEGPAISTHQVTGTIENPETIEIPLEVTSNTIREFAVQEKQPNNGNLKALWDAHNKLKAENGYGHPPAIWIDWVELEGPRRATPQRWKQRREVELHANAKVRGVYNGYYDGGHEKAKAFLETGKPQEGILDEQEAKFRMRVFEENGPSFKRYLDDPLAKTGSLLTISKVNKEAFIALPPEQPSGWHKTKHVVETLPPGEYKLRFRIGAVAGTPTERHFIDLGIVPAKDQFNHLQTFHVTGTTEQPQTFEASVSLTQDGPRKFALREKRDPQGDQARFKAAIKETGVGPPPALWIDWVEWEGPIHAASGEAGFTSWWVGTDAGLEERPRARKILEQFAVRALRGDSPGTDFIDRLITIFETRRAAGEPFDLAIRTPLSVILASPGFLYLHEPSDEVKRRLLSDRELAVRLSYFLWSAPPDAELLELAAANRLHQPDILRQQVDRLLADARSDAFVAGFVHQWLDMERLDFFQFDTTLHREFDESTRSASRQEVYHSFGHLLRDGKDGRLGKLLKSDYVFINGLLATYYGIDGVTGDTFQKISLPTDSPRGGLLGMAAIHAMGSDGVESSPVERGAWVLRHLLHDPPPPAPPNVPQLSRLADQPLTTREKLAAHMEEAQCASCHRKIDPIGFGLENFDAAGKWRSEERHFTKNSRGKIQVSRNAHPIDTSGAFHNGPAFADYHELRDLIAAREDAFARGFTEHLIEYGLGRPFGFTDIDLADEIVSAGKERQYTVSGFFHALVQSNAFRSK